MISIVPIQLHSDIDAENIAIPQLFFVGNPVDHLLIHRCAQGMLVALVSFEGRNPTHIENKLFRHLIEFQRCGAGLSDFLQPVHHNGDDSVARP